MRHIAGIRGSAIGPDVIPSPVNWSNVEHNADSGNFIYSAQQITNISSSILISVVFTTTFNGFLRYKINSDGATPSSSSAPSANGFSALNSTNSFRVARGEWVIFCAEDSTNKPSLRTVTVTVRNNTNSLTTLDTFTAKTMPPLGQPGEL